MTIGEALASPIFIDNHFSNTNILTTTAYGRGELPNPYNWQLEFRRSEQY